MSKEAVKKKIKLFGENIKEKYNPTKKTEFKKICKTRGENEKFKKKNPDCKRIITILCYHKSKINITMIIF